MTTLQNGKRLQRAIHILARIKTAGIKNIFIRRWCLRKRIRLIHIAGSQRRHDVLLVPHRNPIPSETLKFLVESRGFESRAVMKLRPWDAARIAGDSEIIKRFNEYFYGAPDYGIIARKP